jgi:hypothetical protein
MLFHGKITGMGFVAIHALETIVLHATGLALI